MEKKVLGGLFQINPVTKTGQRLYMVRENEKPVKNKLLKMLSNGKEMRGGQFKMKIKKSPFLSGSHAAPTFSAHHCSNHPGRFYI